MPHENPAQPNCAICGKPLIYFACAKPLTCTLCGKEETGRCMCEAEHYVCDACHRSCGVAHIIRICCESASTDPIALAQQIMADKSIYPNGPEHHTLVGAVLLAAYHQAGGSVDLEAACTELERRSLQVPGGTCGYWGCCGAAISAGQFYAIISGATPLSEEPWAASARLTSRILARIADIGGPRCCKRTSFAAIEESVRYIEETKGIHMTLPARISCHFMAGNDQCKKQACPYFPTTKKAATADPSPSFHRS